MSLFLWDIGEIVERNPLPTLGQWHIKRIFEKGFAFNDEIIENNGKVTYFDKLIERIHDIRLTENVFWRKVLDIYSTSIDYDPKAEYSILLFKMVQNKKYWVLNGQDAAGKVNFRLVQRSPI